jgi:hypothetical protein
VKTHQLVRELVLFPDPTPSTRGLLLVSAAEPSAARPREEAPGAGPHHSAYEARWRCPCGYKHPVAGFVARHKASCPDAPQTGAQPDA